MGRLDQLTQTLVGHQAVENAFYTAWESDPFTVPQLRLFVRNYGAFVEWFPAALALLIVNTDDVAARTEYSKTLFSELGYGNPDKAHSVLFYAFFSTLADRLGAPQSLNRESLVHDTQLLPTTIAFIEGERKLYAAASKATAAGAQLALEWQAYTMLRRLYEGARNYMHLWDNQDEFHEACEYFYAHIGAAEKDHKIESMEAAKKYADSEENLRAIESGFNNHLSLIASFWNGIADHLDPSTRLHQGGNHGYVR